MKNLMLISATILMLVLTIVLGSIFSADLHREKLQASRVKIYPENKHFIIDSEVKRLIHITDSTAVDVALFEKKLQENKYIVKAEVFKDLNGNLAAEIYQYKPIARVMDGHSYYIDAQGVKRPLSDHYTENVMLVYGKVSQKQYRKVVRWVQKINKDPMLHDIVSELHVASNYYTIRTNNNPAVFVLDTRHPQEQLYKLKIMYAYLAKHQLKNKYQQIDLRYNKQVVCKK